MSLLRAPVVDPALSQEFSQAVQEIKLRAPIEDVVREHVPALRKSGALWVACCPFHEEKTPSFKVDPRRGTWHCYGTCSEGGDQISFLERFTGLKFMEVLEILSDRTGIEIPKSHRPSPESTRERDADLDLLRRAAQFFERELAGTEGAPARAYLEGRSLDRETCDRFGLGWSPAAGRALCDLAAKSGTPLERLERVGLARRNDSGRGYDFFRGRLMFPIRDPQGRTVGFGARRLGDDGGGPKYVNTPETELFKKNQLVYGLDLALREARRSRHLILVEGYTDVMAAHQVGLARVGAVLGTSTTENHAALVRRSGAQRVSLVFDGDAAGSAAARRALHGLLALEVELEIVRLPGGQDPCDLLLAEGAEGFLRRVEGAVNWFDHLSAGLEGLRGAELSREVDELLDLIQLVGRPVHRQSLAVELARRLGVSVETLREQWRTSKGGRRRSSGPAAGQRASQEAAAEPLGAPEGPSEVDPVLARAFEDLVGALLLDASLVPLVRPEAGLCEDEDLARILEVVLEMYEDLDAVIDTSSVLTALGDHPARRRVASLAAHAGCAASPKALLDGGLERLRRQREGRREEELRSRFLELESRIHGAAEEAACQEARSEQEKVLTELEALLRRQRVPTDPTRDGVEAAPVTPTAT